MRSVITLSGSEYIGMCAPYDPDDNYQVGEIGTAPADAYFVPRTWDFESYPVLAVPVSAKTAVIIERSTTNLPYYRYALYAVNRTGSYDPLIEECVNVNEVDPADYMPRNLWVNAHTFHSPFNSPIINAYSPQKGRLVVVMRANDGVMGGDEYVDDDSGKNYQYATMFGPNMRLEVFNRYYMDYHIDYYDVPNNAEIVKLCGQDFRDSIIIPVSGREWTEGGAGGGETELVWEETGIWTITGSFGETVAGADRSALEAALDDYEAEGGDRLTIGFGLLGANSQYLDETWGYDTTQHIGEEVWTEYDELGWTADEPPNSEEMFYNGLWRYRNTNGTFPDGVFDIVSDYINGLSVSAATRSALISAYVGLNGSYLNFWTGRIIGMRAHVVEGGGGDGSWNTFSVQTAETNDVHLSGDVQMNYEHRAEVWWSVG